MLRATIKCDGCGAEHRNMEIPARNIAVFYYKDDDGEPCASAGIRTPEGWRWSGGYEWLRIFCGQCVANGTYEAMRLVPPEDSP